MMLYGRPGHGKTTLAMQLAAAIAGCTDNWLGFPIEDVGPVVWLQLDMPRPELKLLLNRAIAHWPNILDTVHFFQITQDDSEVSEVNVLGGDAALLIKEVRTLKPKALFIDTAADTYITDPKSDLNQQVRRVVRSYRDIAQGGAVVYLQHQRKRMQSAMGDDPDSYLGGMSWSGIATSVLQLQATTKEDKLAYDLYLRKTRLANVHMERLELLKDKDGFLTAKWTAKAAILGWPHNVPVAKRGSDSRDAIMAALSQQFSLERDSLRQALHRLGEHEKPAWARDGL